MGFNTNLIIATILVSLASFVMIGGIIEVATYYNIPVDDQLQGSFDEYEATQAQFEETQTIIQGGDINEEGFDQAIYKNVIVAGKQVQAQSEVSMSFLNQINKYIPIQATIIAMLGTILFVLTLFGFLSMITKRSP